MDSPEPDYSSGRLANLTVSTVFMQVSRLTTTPQSSLCQEPWPCRPQKHHSDRTGLSEAVATRDDAGRRDHEHAVSGPRRPAKMSSVVTQLVTQCSQRPTFRP